jgi:hypothetical protein
MSKVKWLTGATMLACTGALVACQSGSPASPAASAGTTASASATASAVATATGPASPSVAPPAPGSPSVAPPPAPGGSTDAVLSGKREVTIVRVQASESGVSLDGRLVEADDDSGRQLFVPTPLGGDTYLIKAFGRANNHPAADEPSCWQVHNPRTSEPLTVEGAVCDQANPAQRFTITTKGKGTYAISNSSAYLQFSSSRGLILEELGDAPLLSTFRFVDNGPARRPAGG